MPGPGRGSIGDEWNAQTFQKGWRASSSHVCRSSPMSSSRYGLRRIKSRRLRWTWRQRPAVVAREGITFAKLNGCRYEAVLRDDLTERDTISPFVLIQVGILYMRDNAICLQKRPEEHCD
jgi:hypothetical protein